MILREEAGQNRRVGGLIAYSLYDKSSVAAELLSFLRPEFGGLCHGESSSDFRDMVDSTVAAFGTFCALR